MHQFAGETEEVRRSHRPLLYCLCHLRRIRNCLLGIESQNTLSQRQLSPQHGHLRRRARNLLWGHFETEEASEPNREVAHRRRPVRTERRTEDVVDVAGFKSQLQIVSAQSRGLSLLQPAAERRTPRDAIQRLPELVVGKRRAHLAKPRVAATESS